MPLSPLKIPRPTLLLVASLGLACHAPRTTPSQPENPFWSLKDVQTRWESTLQSTSSSGSALRFLADLTEITEATGDTLHRSARVTWIPGLGFWFEQPDGFGAWKPKYHLLGTERFQWDGDTVYQESVDPWDPLPDYYDGLLLPELMENPRWWEDTLTPSQTWTVPPFFRLLRFDTPSEQEAHPESHAWQQWTLDATNGTPVEYELRWYDGGLAYGCQRNIHWNWLPPDAGGAAWVRDTTLSERYFRAELERNAPGSVGCDGEPEPMVGTTPFVPPPLSGFDLEGHPWALSDFLGSTVLLDFWYIGCGPCMQALPDWDHLQTKYRDQGLRVFGVNKHQDAATIRRYLERRGVWIEPVLPDTSADAWGIAAYPSWFLLDSNGLCVARGLGHGPGVRDNLDSLIQPLLKARP